MTKHKTKRRNTRRKTISNNPVKLIGYSTKAVIGISVLGATASALSNIKKT